MIPVHKMSSESHCWKKEIDTVKNRLFTVLYFSVRSSRSSAMCYGLPSCMSVPDARPLGTFENQDTRDGKTQYI